MSFKPRGTYFYGRHKGFHIVIDTSNENKNIVGLYYSVSFENEKGMLHNFLDSKKSNSIIEQYDIDDKSLVVSFNSSNHMNYSIKNFMDDLAPLLIDLEGRQNCLKCDSQKNIKLYGIDNSISFLCDDCRDKMKTNIENQKNVPTNYLAGFIGSLIGALVGSLGWIILGYFNFYASIAGYAIAFTAFWGYSYMKGLNTNTGVAINIVSIVIAILFAEYMGIFLQFFKEVPDLTLILFMRATPNLLRDSQFMGSILPSLGLGFVFAGLGSYRLIKKMLLFSNEVRNVEFESLEV